MNRTLNPTISKRREESFSQKLEVLLAEFREKTRETRAIHKEIDKLRRSNERSFERARKAVDALSNY